LLSRERGLTLAGNFETWPLLGFLSGRKAVASVPVIAAWADVDINNKQYPVGKKKKHKTCASLVIGF